MKITREKREKMEERYSNYMTAIGFALIVFGVLARYVSSAWVLIEFALYLFKDSVFNWWSVAFAVSMWVFYGISFLVAGVFVAAKTQLDEQYRENKPKKSRFQERLDRAMEEAKENYKEKYKEN